MRRPFLVVRSRSNWFDPLVKRVVVLGIPNPGGAREARWVATGGAVMRVEVDVLQVVRTNPVSASR